MGRKLYGREPHAPDALKGAPKGALKGYEMKKNWFTVNLIVVVVVALAGIAYFGVELPERFTEFAAGAAGRGVLAVFFLLVLLGNIVAAISQGFGEKERYIRFTNVEGAITISIKAVEEALALVAQSIAEVDKATVILSRKETGDEPMEISAQVVAFDYPNIREISEKIQTVMKARLEEILTQSEKVRFNVNIERFAPR